MGRRWYADAGARRPARRVRHVVLDGDARPRSRPRPRNPLEPCRHPTLRWSARPRLRSRQSHGPSSGPRRRRPSPAAHAADEPGSGAAPGLHVHDPVAYHAGRAEAEREAAAGPVKAKAKPKPTHAATKRAIDLPRGHAARRRTARASGRRPLRPRLDGGPRGPRCSSPRRSYLQSRQEGAPSSASRRGAPRGRHEHAPRALRDRRRDGGVRGSPGSAAALDPPSASCNGGGCGGWFRSNVTVSWSYNSAGATGSSGCGASTMTEDTSGAPFTCTVYYRTGRSSGAASPSGRTRRPRT